jgi:hypothetical protein
LETISEFKYLGWILQEPDQDDFAIQANLHKAMPAGVKFFNSQ